jgi:hypothetical protein
LRLERDTAGRQRPPTSLLPGDDPDSGVEAARQLETAMRRTAVFALTAFIAAVVVTGVAIGFSRQHAKAERAEMLADTDRAAAPAAQN